MAESAGRMSRRQVDRLGERLRDNPQAEDISAFEEYRNLFLPPLDQVGQKLVNLGLGTGVTRRIKRTESAIAKLSRQRTLKLSQMQDIAGCRLVVDNLAQQDVVRNMIGLDLAVHNIHDRRQNPSSGYRAVHLVRARRRTQSTRRNSDTDQKSTAMGAHLRIGRAKGRFSQIRRWVCGDTTIT